MDQELDIYQLEALARSYRQAVRALSMKRQQIEEIKASQEEAEVSLVRLEEAKKRAEKALWTYLLGV